MAVAPFKIARLVTVEGDTKPYREYFRKLGGIWVPGFKCWVFDELVLPAVQQLERRAANGELVACAEEEPPMRAAREKVPWYEDINSKGTRTGKRWPPEEEQALLVAVQAHTPLPEIAATHHRTEGGITSRLREIAASMLKDGQSEFEVMKATMLSAEELQQIKQFGPSGDWRSRRRGTAVAPVTPSVAAIMTAAASNSGETRLVEDLI